MKKYIPWAVLVSILLATVAYSTITTNEKYLLNHWGTVGRQTQLGTLIDNAETVTLGELTLADGKIMVGNASNVGAAVDVSGDATIANTGALTITAGSVETSMLAADAVTKAKIADNAVGPEHVDEGQMILDFTRNGATFGGSGTLGAAVVTASAVNAVQSMGKHLEWFNDVQQDAGLKWVAGSGLNISGDATDTDALQFGTGSTASDVSKVVGTDNFYFRAKVKIEDESGTDGFYIGLRKVMAYDTTPGNYDDYYAVGFDASNDPAEIKILSNLDDGGEVSTDTTQTLAATQYIDVKIYVGEEAQLQTSIDLATDLKSVINTHFADATEHTAGQQTALAVATPATVATLIASVTEMQDAYVAHNADANLASDWLYHIADGDDDALASATNPTTLAGCVTVLNDIKTKFALHVADNVSHTDGDTSGASAIDASTTWLQLGVNGALADPTVGKAFDFAAAEVVMPYIYVLQDGDLLGYVYVQNWEVVDTVTE